MNCCDHEKNNDGNKLDDGNNHIVDTGNKHEFDHEHDHEDGQKHNHKGHLSHMWMMALCCGAPILLVFVISLLGSSTTGLKSTLFKILPFLCPVMMIAMLPMMLKGKKEKQ